MKTLMICFVRCSQLIARKGFSKGSRCGGYAPPHRFFCFLSLLAPLQSTFDNFVLYSRLQVYKERTESGDTDHQVAVFFRVFLRVSEDFGIQHIELNVIAVILEQGSDQVHHVVPARAVLELIGRELYVHVR